MVAIKTFKGGNTDISRKELMKEITKEHEFTSKLHHENIVKSLKIEMSQSGKLIMALDLCEHGTLQDRIGSNGLSSPDFFNLLASLASAIGYLHKMKVAHRDLKPDNIFVAGTRENPIFKIGDFGFARNLELEGKYSSRCGTPEYMHPEMFAACFHAEIGIKEPEKMFGHSHDLWSVGMILYESCTGMLPFCPNEGNLLNYKVMYEMMIEKHDDDISATMIKKEKRYKIQ